MMRWLGSPAFPAGDVVMLLRSTAGNTFTMVPRQKNSSAGLQIREEVAKELGTPMDPYKKVIKVGPAVLGPASPSAVPLHQPHVSCLYLRQGCPSKSRPGQSVLVQHCLFMMCMGEQHPSDRTRAEGLTTGGLAEASNVQCAAAIAALTPVHVPCCSPCMSTQEEIDRWMAQETAAQDNEGDDYEEEEDGLEMPSSMDPVGSRKRGAAAAATGEKPAKMARGTGDSPQEVQLDTQVCRSGRHQRCCTDTMA